MTEQVERAEEPKVKRRSKKSSEKVDPIIPTERVFKSSATLHHDLYILEPAKMIKDTSAGAVGDPDFLVPVVHQHFFHSIDASGREMKECSPIGNHFHTLEVTENPDGGPPTVKCTSGPVKWARVKQRGGKFKKQMVPVNDYDHHTHEVRYLNSQMVTRRQANIEAGKVLASQAMTESASNHQVPRELGEIQG